MQHPTSKPRVLRIWIQQSIAAGRVILAIRIFNAHGPYPSSSTLANPSCKFLGGNSRLAQNSRKRPGLNLLVIGNNADAGTLAHDNVTATLPFALIPMGFENG